ncbi:hypothetical protein EVAR_15873_1 [Eumeta japonica]|uniref:Uncharacterized protein n=1 Tax=Eumeta variegata TaxID=151549 RepID=A0A4C1UEX8_EUMVA|nr:hypothetical protein EVAR_15873_1 [Eumeta japonica]
MNATRMSGTYISVLSEARSELFNLMLERYLISAFGNAELLQEISGFEPGTFRCGNDTLITQPRFQFAVKTERCVTFCIYTRDVEEDRKVQTVVAGCSVCNAAGASANR